MGTAKTDAKARRDLRKRLEAQRLPVSEVNRQVEELRERQGRAWRPPAAPRRARTPGEVAKRDEAAARREEQLRVQRRRSEQIIEAQRVRAVEDDERRRVEDETYARLSPDDRGFRPAKPDSVLTGAARATGDTARAVRRGKTFTKWQLEERDR
jgi:hypothetical protein